LASCLDPQHHLWATGFLLIQEGSKVKSILPKTFLQNFCLTVGDIVILGNQILVEKTLQIDLLNSEIKGIKIYYVAQFFEK